MPELVAMLVLLAFSRASLALLIAIISASITLGGLIWQITLYHLSGARLEVQLIPAAVNQDATIVESGGMGWSKRTIGHVIDELGEWTVELALVRVTNVGRMAVSVADVSLDFGKRDWYRRRSRYTAAGHPVVVGRGADDNHARLDVGESMLVYYDLWALVAHARERLSHRGQQHVRATAKPAAKRAVRSPRRAGWRIGADQESLVWASLTPDQRAYRALWRSIRRAEDGPVWTGVTWWEVQHVLHESQDRRKVADVLAADIDDSRSWAIAADEIVSAYLGTDHSTN